MQMVLHIPDRYVLHPTADIDLMTSKQETAIIIGPEGGLSSLEIKLCEEQGWGTRRMDTPVLRSDTAAIVAATHLI
jgi:RsmE family RNA methyltransferase